MASGCSTGGSGWAPGGICSQKGWLDIGIDCQGGGGIIAPGGVEGRWTWHSVAWSRWQGDVWSQVGWTISGVFTPSWCCESRPRCRHLWRRVNVGLQSSRIVAGVVQKLLTQGWEALAWQTKMLLKWEGVYWSWWYWGNFLEAEEDEFWVESENGDGGRRLPWVCRPPDVCLKVFCLLCSL